MAGPLGEEPSAFTTDLSGTVDTLGEVDEAVRKIIEVNPSLCPLSLILGTPTGIEGGIKPRCAAEGSENTFQG